MGLDMYLVRKVPLDHTKSKSKLEYDIEDLCYWRKANMVHRWFEEEIGYMENCEDIPVSVEELELLCDVCKQVVEKPEIAPDMLPTQPGFFFGNTDYGEEYFDDVKETIHMLVPVIERFKGKDVTLFYYASW